MNPRLRATLYHVARVALATAAASAVSLLIPDLPDVPNMTPELLAVLNPLAWAAEKWLRTQADGGAKPVVASPNPA